MPAPGPVTGEAVDGDTVRLATGPSVRLFGIDAPELKQPGYRRDGSPIPLGTQARDALATMIGSLPMTLGSQKGQSYGRPVSPISVADTDIGNAMVRDGNALAAPNYLAADPTRRFDYLQSERLARLNRLGMHNAYTPDPAEFRANPDYVPDRQTVARFWDEPTPMAGMRPQAEKQYLDLLLGTGTTAQIVDFVRSQGGFNVDPAEVQAFIEKRDAANAKGQPLNVNGVAYRALPTPLTDVGDGALGAGARSVGTGLLANGLDELGAVADTFGATPGRESIWNSDRRLADIWANNQRQNASILGFDEFAHPKLTTGGQIAGAITSSFAIPYGAGATTVPALARAGAVFGGLEGFLGEDGGILDRTRGAAIGTIAGGALNAAGGKALQFALPALGNAGRRISGRAAPEVEPSALRGTEVPDGFVMDQPQANANMDAVGLPLPSGSRALDVIDVNAGRATRMMDSPTDAMLRAGAARVDPGDVLPRPVDAALPSGADDSAVAIPATADSDWNEAVSATVGNIRVDKLESPQDIERALRVADDVAGGFDAARRGQISFAETQALAQDLGMTADDLLARRKGQAFSAEEAYAARSILAKSGNELVNMAKRIRALSDDPGSEALAAFRKALVRHAAIQEQVSGMTAEAGRALSAFRMAADSRDIPGRVLEGLATAGGGTGRLQDAAERIVDLAEDPANLNRFVDKVSKPTFADRVQEVWYNYLLSGPQTHMVNILSNTMTALGQIPEHAVAAGVGAARRALGSQETDRVLFSELGARSIGLLQGTKEGLREFARAFRTGEASDFVTKMEAQTQKAVPGIMGDVLRVPTRLLTGEDELFKAMARRMELTGLAVRQAAQEGRTGQEARERVAELIANPPDDMMEKVLDYGRYLTFQRPLGDGLAGTLSRYSQNHPAIKAVLPFIRTPTNLIKFTAERSPLAPMVKEWRKDFAAGGSRRDLAVAKVMVGSGVGALIAELAAQGVITGSAPSDDNQRGLMLASGWQPYSIRIGDTYYSYRRLDPFAMTFGTAADLATMGDGMTESQREKGAALWTASVVANLASRTWLSGVTDALEALQDPERYSGNFIKRLIGSATVPTGVAQLARTIDPTMRETPDIASYMSSRLPGESDNLLPKRDVWGQPIVSQGGIGPDILSPIWTSTDRNDAITDEALRVGATVSKPQKGDMTPEEYDRLQEVAGATARGWIGKLIASPEYQALGTEAQADEIGDLMAKARKAAKASLRSGEPIPDAMPKKPMRGRKAKLPDGYVMDAPPAGFVLD